VSDSQLKKRVLSNIAMMRIHRSELAEVFAQAMPSDEPEVDVVVTLTEFDADMAAQVRALVPEARVVVQRGARPHLCVS
jgi:hypothetical protein